MTKLIGTNTNQVPSNGDLGTAAFMDKSEFISSKPQLMGAVNKTLRSLSSSGSVNDVFVYDTRLDSDGGDWRKRTQGTSWYNEELNTATRGSRKEFPQVAVIVATSGRSDLHALTIYDADDSNLPMWMVFKNLNQSGGDDQTSTVNYFAAGPYEAKTISAINGEIFNGQIRSAGDIAGIVKGVTRFNLIDDSSKMVTDEGTFLREGNIGDQRNVSHRYKLLSNLTKDRCFRSNVYGIDTKIHANAPINPETGLPMPTIVTASESGISIQYNNGSWIYKSGSSKRNTHFYGEDEYISMGAGDALEIYGLYDNDVGTSYLKGVRAYNGNPATSLYPFLPGNGGEIVPTGDASFAYAGDGVPLALYTEAKEQTGSLASGHRSMQARITDTFNTGWMFGKGKLAFACSNQMHGILTENSTQLVDNSTMSNTTGYLGVYGNAWYLDNFTISGGTLNATGASTSFAAEDASNGKTVIGKRYVVEFDVTAISGGNITISFSTGGSQTTPVTTTGFYRFSGYVSGNTRIYIRGNSFTGSIDNWKIYEALDGYSYGGKHPRVMGEVSHSAVNAGSELGAYGPFSTDSAVIFPYDSELDFGGDAQTYTYWVNTENVPSYQTHFSREYHTGSAFSGGGQIEAYTETGGGYLRLYFSDDNFSSYDVWNSTKPIFGKGWVHVAIVKTQDKSVYTYLDGELDNVHILTAALGSMSNTSAELIIGNQHPNYGSKSGSTDTRICLFKCHNGNPDQHQIRKIYRDEKEMIAPGAKVTIAAGNIAGLAFDMQHKKLYASGGGSTTVHNNLVRIDTLDVSADRMSAVNGLLVSN